MTRVGGDITGWSDCFIEKVTFEQRFEGGEKVKKIHREKKQVEGAAREGLLKCGLHLDKQH